MGLWGISPQEPVQSKTLAADPPKQPERGLWSERAEPAALPGCRQAESATLGNSAVGVGSDSDSARPSSESVSPLKEA